MKKLLLTAMAALSIVSTAILPARTPAGEGEYHSTFQVSFFPPLGTNGRHASRYTNDVSLNLLVGISKNEKAFAFAGLANVIRNNAYGVQFAGLFNYVGNEGLGFMFGGMANIVRNDYRGLQFGGLFNTVSGLDGFQFGGLANIASGKVDGFQFGGLFNTASGLDGLQFGGLANIVRGNVDGFQFGGLVNVAKRVRGVQFAGIVNIAEKSDYPIGIVNIIKEGEMGIGIGYNELGTVSLTFRSGGRVLYGILGLGYNHKIADGKNAVSVAGGYGAHINILPWLRINNELTSETVGAIGDDKFALKSGYALLPAFRIGDFEIFGGPSINHIYCNDPEMNSFLPKGSLWEKNNGSRSQQLYIGWQAGAQFVF